MTDLKLDTHLQVRVAEPKPISENPDILLQPYCGLEVNVAQDKSPQRVVVGSREYKISTQETFISADDPRLQPFWEKVTHLMASRDYYRALAIDKDEGALLGLPNTLAEDVKWRTLLDEIAQPSTEPEGIAQLNDNIPPGEVDQTLWSEIYKDTHEQVQAYQKTVVEKHPPITFQTMIVEGLGDEPFTINYVGFGVFKINPDQAWNRSLYTLQCLAQMQQTLGVQMPDRTFTMFDMQNFANETPGEVRDTLAGYMDSHGKNIKSLKSIILAPLARTFQERSDTSAFLKIFSRFEQTVQKHEITHYADPYIEAGTAAHKEGFARMMDQGCDFMNCVRDLRLGHDTSLSSGERFRPTRYGKPITREFVEFLLNGDPKNKISPVEVYGVSSTFFAYVYEKFGPQGFMQFYGLVSGGLAFTEEPQADGSSRYATQTYVENQGAQNRCRGDLAQSLKIAASEKFDYDSFMAEYIRRVNAPI